MSKTELAQAEEPEYVRLVTHIQELLEGARKHIAKEVNTTMVETYWHIGQYIVEYEQRGGARAVYLSYPKIRTLPGQLSFEDEGRRLFR